MNLTKRERIERTAAEMRARPKTGGKSWINRTRSRDGWVAANLEASRQYPFAVVYTLGDLEAVFGYSADRDGGGVLKLARLVPWAKNPRVIAASILATEA